MSPPWAGSFFPAGWDASSRLTTGALGVFAEEDQSAPTRLRRDDLASRRLLGWPGLPEWLPGARTSQRTAAGDTLPWPQDPFWLCWRDLSVTGPAALLLWGARTSRDPGFSLGTGVGSPAFRAAYLLAGGGRALPAAVRPASGLWDFLTAVDAVSLPTEQGDLVLRNLDGVALTRLTAAAGTALLVPLPSGALPDAVAAAVWNGVRSQEDAVYAPALRTDAPVPTGLDLSGGRLGRPTGVTLDAAFTASALVLPTPRWPDPLPAHAPGAAPWASFRMPFGLDPTADAPATAYLWTQNSTAPGGHALSDAAGTALGTAHPIDLRNAWDTAGETVRCARRPGEDDAAFGGRLQRLWLAALISTARADPSGCRARVDRALSAGLGRTLIADAWTPGATALPADTRRADTGNDLARPATLQLTLSQGDIAPDPLETGVYACREDLSAWDRVSLTTSGLPLFLGRDYVLSPTDPTRLLLRRPLPPGADLTLQLSGHSAARPLLGGVPGRCPETGCETRRARATRVWGTATPFDGTTRSFAGAGDAFPLSALTGVSGATPSSRPLIAHRGPRTQTADAIGARRLEQPGGAFLTPLGGLLLGARHLPRWGDPDLSARRRGLPWDLDTAFAAPAGLYGGLDDTLIGDINAPGVDDTLIGQTNPLDLDGGTL